MEGEPAFPDADQLERVREEPLLVEQRVAQAAAQDDRQHQPADEVADLFFGERQVAVFHQPVEHEPGDQETGQVSEAVPADLQWAEVQRDGIPARKPDFGEQGDHEGTKGSREQ